MKVLVSTLLVSTLVACGAEHTTPKVVRPQTPSIETTTETTTSTTTDTTPASSTKSSSSSSQPTEATQVVTQTVTPTATPAPSAPTIGALTISDVPDATGTRPTLTWDASSKANSYTLIVSKEEDCSKAILTYNNLTATAQQLSFLSEGTYYAYVKAVDGNGNEVAASKYFEFDIAYSILPINYPVASINNNVTKITYTSTFNLDMTKGIAFTCTIASTTYNMYKFHGAIIVDMNMNTMGIYNEAYYLANWVPYGCQTY